VHNHTQAAVGHDGPFERSVGLETHDYFIISINVARAMRGDGTRNQRDVEHTFLPLFYKELVQPIPQVLGSLCRGRKEGFVSFVRLVVLLDEVANINLPLPETCLESLPWGNHFLWRDRMYDSDSHLRFSLLLSVKTTSWYFLYSFSSETGVQDLSGSKRSIFLNSSRVFGPKS